MPSLEDQVEQAAARAVVTELMKILRKEGWNFSALRLNESVTINPPLSAIAKIFSCSEMPTSGIFGFKKGERLNAWVEIFFGNGWDCIYDYSTSLTSIIVPLFDRIEDRGFTVSVRLNK